MIIRKDREGDALKRTLDHKIETDKPKPPRPFWARRDMSHLKDASHA